MPPSQASLNGTGSPLHPPPAPSGRGGSTAAARRGRSAPRSPRVSPPEGSRCGEGSAEPRAGYRGGGTDPRGRADRCSRDGGSPHPLPEPPSRTRAPGIDRGAAGAGRGPRGSEGLRSGRRPRPTARPPTSPGGGPSWWRGGPTLVPPSPSGGRTRPSSGPPPPGRWPTRGRSPSALDPRPASGAQP